LLFARPLHSIIISSSTDIHSCIHSSYSSTVRYLASKGNNSGCTSTGSVRVHPTNHIQMEKKKKSPTTATHTASVKEALPTKGSSKSSSTLPAAAAAVVVDCDEAHTAALPVRVPPPPPPISHPHLTQSIVDSSRLYATHLSHHPYLLLCCYNFLYQIIEQIPYSTVHHTSAPMLPTSITYIPYHTTRKEHPHPIKHTEIRKEDIRYGPPSSSSPGPIQYS